MLQILIAEDNVAFRLFLKEIMARRFPAMAIDEAVDGDQALLCGKLHHYDLIFMDINMPGKNGLDVTRAIKNCGNRAVVCLITHHDLQEYRNAARECGADYFIVKDELSESMIASLVESIFNH